MSEGDKNYNNVKNNNNNSMTMAMIDGDSNDNDDKSDHMASSPRHPFSDGREMERDL